MTQTVPSATIEDALYAWVAAASGVPVIWEHQNAPRPAAPYVSLLLATVEPTGRDWDGSEANPLTFDDKAIESVDTGTSLVTITGHALATGDGPVQVETDGTLPSGLEEEHDYWWVRQDDDRGAFAESLVKANAGTTVPLADAGTGAHAVVSTADTRRRGAEITSYSRGMRRCRLVMTCFAASATGIGSAMGILEAVAAKANLPARRAALRAAGIGVPVFGAAQAAGGALNPAYFEPRAVKEAVFFPASEVSETGTYVEYVGVTQQVENAAGDALAEVTAIIPSNPFADPLGFSSGFSAGFAGGYP